MGGLRQTADQLETSHKSKLASTHHFLLAKRDKYIYVYCCVSVCVSVVGVENYHSVCSEG